MATTTVEDISKNEWEKFLESYKKANFLQSWNWGEFHYSLGKTVKRVGFFEKEKLSGVMLCVLEKAKRATYLTVPGGPLIDWGNEKLVQLFKDTILSIAKKEGAAFVRVRPQILETPENSKLFESLGFKNAP